MRKSFRSRPFLDGDGSAAANASGGDDAAVTPRLRAVLRGAADLRRGVPLLLTGDAPLVLLAAEVALAGPLGEFEGLAAEPGLLLLAPARAAALLQRPVAQGVPAVAIR